MARPDNSFEEPNSSYNEDDFVVADMSGIERKSLFLPKLPSGGADRSMRPQMPDRREERPWEQTRMDFKERLIFIGGAVSAGLAIAAVFGIAFAAVILLILSLGM